MHSFQSLLFSQTATHREVTYKDIKVVLRTYFAFILLSFYTQDNNRQRPIVVNSCNLKKKILKIIIGDLLRSVILHVIRPQTQSRRGQNVINISYVLLSLLYSIQYPLYEHYFKCSSLNGNA